MNLCHQSPVASNTFLSHTHGRNSGVACRVFHLAMGATTWLLFQHDTCKVPLNGSYYCSCKAILVWKVIMELTL